MKLLIFSILSLFILQAALNVECANTYQVASPTDSSISGLSVWDALYYVWISIKQLFSPYNGAMNYDSQEAAAASFYTSALDGVKVLMKGTYSMDEKLYALGNFFAANSDSSSPILVMYLLGDLQQYNNKVYMMVQNFTGNFSSLLNIVVPLLQMNNVNLPKSAQSTTILGVIQQSGVLSMKLDLKGYLLYNLYEYLDGIDVPNYILSNASECANLTYYSFYCDYNITNLYDLLKYLYVQANELITLYKDESSMGKPNKYDRPSKVHSRPTNKTSTWKTTTWKTSTWKTTTPIPTKKTTAKKTTTKKTTTSVKKSG